MISSLIVLGGGTSGLISALMIKKSWPELKVTVIESSTIGIIGVGEGSTEHWGRFMSHIDLNVPDLIREAGATYKIGIKFNNWHGDQTSYWHSLGEDYTKRCPSTGLYYMLMGMIGDNRNQNESVYKFSRDSHHAEPLHLSTAQYHFDTFKLNTFLHKKAKERGIEFIDTDIVDVELDEQGYVSSLIDNNNQRYSSDFYIDCSGFKRIIGTKLGIKWISCQEELPMNSAMAFPTPGTDDIPSYTEATALTSGWMWRIPTQERYGNGYVFCDSFITEDQAQQELESIHGKVNIGRRIKFTPGYVNRSMVKNCAMIGLSSIFVEPLEASSIGTTIQQIFLLIPNLFHFSRGDGNRTSNMYNQYMEEINQNVIDFIQLHYFTQRSDSEFWRWCKSNGAMTEFNRNTLEYFKTNWPNHLFFNNQLALFSSINWIQVMWGLRLFDSSAIKSKIPSSLRPLIDSQEEEIDQYVSSVQTFSHRESIEILKTRYSEISYAL